MKQDWGPNHRGPSCCPERALFRVQGSGFRVLVLTLEACHAVNRNEGFSYVQVCITL